EALSFRDALEQLREAGAGVLGVSRDTVESQQRFDASNSLGYPLLSDRDGSIARAYGVAGGLLRGGPPKPDTFLIAPDGRVLHRFYQVRPSGHRSAVLAKLLEQSPPPRSP